MFSRNGDIESGLIMLGDAFPNPAAADISIPLLIGRDNASVQLEFFDLMGKKVKGMGMTYEKAGVHTLRWDGRDDGGTEVSSGMILYRLTTSEGQQAKRLIRK